MAELISLGAEILRVLVVSGLHDRNALAAAMAEAINRALDADWKTTRGPVAAQYARNRFSVTGQVSHLLAEVDRLTS